MGKEKFKNMTDEELQNYIDERERERVTYRKKNTPRVTSKADKEAKELSDLAKQLGLTAEDMKDLKI